MKIAIIGLGLIGGSLANVASLQSRQAHGVGRGGSDGRGAAGGHVPDGLGDGHVVGEVDERQSGRQLPLVYHDDLSVLEPYGSDILSDSVYECLHADAIDGTVLSFR